MTAVRATTSCRTPASLATVTLRLVALVPVSTKGGSAVTCVICTNLSTTFRRATAVAVQSTAASSPVGVTAATRSYTPNVAALAFTGRLIVAPGAIVGAKRSGGAGERPVTVMAYVVARLPSLVTDRSKTAVSPTNAAATKGEKRTDAPCCSIWHNSPPRSPIAPASAVRLASMAASPVWVDRSAAMVVTAVVAVTSGEAAWA